MAAASAAAEASTVAADAGNTAPSTVGSQLARSEKLHRILVQFFFLGDIS